MTAKEIAAAVNRLAPESLSARLVAEFSEYDNTGLLIDPECGEIERVLVALDADCGAVREAVEKGCGMIVSHHPVIYRGIKSLLPSDGEQKNYLTLVRAGIAVYSAHLSLDAAKEGINASLARALDLVDTRPLLDLGEGAGLLFAGDFRGSMEELCAKLFELTGAPMRVSQNAGSPLRVAVLNGGGAEISYMEQARAAGCNTLVSGDAKHHAFVWAKNNGFNLVDAGHFETEHFYLKQFTRALAETCAGVSFIMSGEPAPYFIFGGKS